MQAVRRLNPPGRFLERTEDGNAWTDAPEERIKEKCAQALREKKWSKNPPKVRFVDKEAGESANEQASEGKREQIRAPPRVATEPTATASLRLIPKEWGPEAVADNVKLPPALDFICVGSRIAVYWPLDHAFYNAWVLRREARKILVQYDIDGVEEWLDLADHDYKINV